MITLSVLVRENDGPHIYIYTLKHYLLHVCARSEGVENYNCDNKFLILGVSFRATVVTSVYAGTASNCCLKYM